MKKAAIIFSFVCREKTGNGLLRISAHHSRISLLTGANLCRGMSPVTTTIIIIKTHGAESGVRPLRIWIKYWEILFANFADFLPIKKKTVRVAGSHQVQKKQDIF